LAGVSEAFRHTPWDGSSKPFTIGMRPITPADWIEVDARLAAQLDEKARLEAADLAAVFRAEPDTEVAQGEMLEALVANLAAHHPVTHRREDGHMALPASSRRTSA
jgi:dimethylamine monooxygenase subunit A